MKIDRYSTFEVKNTIKRLHTVREGYCGNDSFTISDLGLDNPPMSKSDLLNLKDGDDVLILNRYTGNPETKKIECIWEAKEINYISWVNTGEVGKTDNLPINWKEGRDGKNNVLFCGNITLFSENKNCYHNFPVKGNAVISKNGKKLFFADEENGKHLLEMETSKARNRFYDNETIETQILKDVAVVFVSHDKNYRYIAKK